MSVQAIRRLAGGILLIISLAIWIWGIWPQGGTSRGMDVRPSDLQAPTAQNNTVVINSINIPGQELGSPPPAKATFGSDRPAPIEAGRLVLVWPARLRLGDPGLIYLTMQINPDPDQEAVSHNISPMRIPGNQDQSQANNLLVETSLKISGLQAVPTGEIFEPIQPGQSVKFFWSVRPDRNGIYSGMIWVHLRFVPTTKDPTGDSNAEIRRPLTAQPIELRTIDIFGMGGPQARWLGGIGIFLGCFLSLDGAFLRFWRRPQKKQGPSND